MLLLLLKPVFQALFEEVRCMLWWTNRSLLDPDTESWTGRGVNSLSGSFRTTQAGIHMHSSPLLVIYHDPGYC